MSTLLAVSADCNPRFSEHGSELPSLAAFFDEIPEPEHIGTGIPELFAAALSHKLKHPRIQLRTSGGVEVILKLGGSRSRYPGSVRLVGPGRYPFATFYGSISVDGTLRPTAAMTADVRELLLRMAADPIGVALESAAVSGCCCFCRKRLSDPRSVTHGHGERCAEVWGLRWDAPRAYRGLFGDVWSAVSGAELVGA